MGKLSTDLYLITLSKRYISANRCEKGKILNELCESSERSVVDARSNLQPKSKNGASTGMGASRKSFIKIGRKPIRAFNQHRIYTTRLTRQGCSGTVILSVRQPGCHVNCQIFFKKIPSVYFCL